MGKFKEIAVAVLIVTFILLIGFGMVMVMWGIGEKLNQETLCFNEGGKLESASTLFSDDLIVCKKYENGTMHYFEIMQSGEEVKG